MYVCILFFSVCFYDDSLDWKRLACTIAPKYVITPLVPLPLVPQQTLKFIAGLLCPERGCLHREGSDRENPTQDSASAFSGGLMDWVEVPWMQTPCSLMPSALAGRWGTSQLFCYTNHRTTLNSCMPFLSQTPRTVPINSSAGSPDESFLSTFCNWADCRWREIRSAF